MNDDILPDLVYAAINTFLNLFIAIMVIYLICYGLGWWPK